MNIFIKKNGKGLDQNVKHWFHLWVTKIIADFYFLLFALTIKSMYTAENYFCLKKNVSNST